MTTRSPSSFARVSPRPSEGVAMGVIFLTIAICLSGCGGPGPSAAHDEPAEGRDLFAGTGCGVCHGPGGRGDGPLVTAGRVASVDLADRGTLRYGPSVAQIVAVIADGRTSERGSMPPHAHLSSGELSALATYVQELAKETNGD